MDYAFREKLTVSVRDYASNTPHAEGAVVDCTLGVNPYGFAPEVAQVLRTYDYSNILRYPHSDTLHTAVQRHWDGVAALKKENIALCNGSFLGLFCLNNVLAGARKTQLVSFAPTFTDMLTSASFFGMEIVPVLPAAGAGLRFDTRDLLRAITPDTALVYLDRPNNPTGSVLSKEDVCAVLQAAGDAGCFVLVDEAFADFLPQEESCVSLFDAFDNLIVTRTFSKGLGLADLRAGYILAPERVTALIAKTLNPFVLSEFVRQACAEALRHGAYARSHASDFAAAKQALRDAIGSDLEMAETDDRVPILALHSRSGQDLQSAFLKRGILTVAGAEFESLDDSYVRVSIPAGADAKALVAAAAQIDREARGKA